MIPAQRPAPRTYRQILLAPPGKSRFLLLLLVTMALFSTVAGLASLAPRDYSGMAGINAVDIEVTFSTEQPVHIRMSHTFKLVSTNLPILRNYYYVEDGVDTVNYTINITDSSGDLVTTIEDSVSAPVTHEFYSYETEDTVTVEKVHDVALDPGRYALSFTAWHDLSYEVVQSSRFEPLAVFLGFLGALAVVVVVFMLYRTYRTWEREMRAVAAFGAPVFYGPPAFYRPPPAVLPYQAMNYSAPARNVVEDDDVVEYMCAKCGNIIQNPIVQNVITCERCGEKEHVG